MPKVVLAGSDGLPYPSLTAVLQNTANIVLFGDSVMERVSRHDQDRRTLGQMIAGNSASSVLTVSRSAHNPDIYLPLLRALSKARHKPHTIILPVNMRCFSPQWQMSPDWQFTQEKTIIARYLRWRWPVAPVADVHYDPAKHAVFDQLPVEYKLSAFRKIGDFKAAIASEPSCDRSAAIFTYHYTHDLDLANARLQNLQQCVKIAKSIAPQVFVYVTPINVQALNRFVGPEAVSILLKNVDVLASALDHDRFKSFVDAIPEDQFFSEDLATEHLNEVGRVRLASLIG
jgi:hypothetical protein